MQEMESPEDIKALCILISVLLGGENKDMKFFCI